MCKAMCKDMCKDMWNNMCKELYLMCKDMYVQGTIPSNVLCTMHCSGDYIDIGSELSSGSFILVSDTGLEQEEVRELGSDSSVISFCFELLRGHLLLLLFDQCFFGQKLCYQMIWGLMRTWGGEEQMENKLIVTLIYCDTSIV